MAWLIWSKDVESTMKLQNKLLTSANEKQDSQIILQLQMKKDKTGIAIIS